MISQENLCGLHKKSFLYYLILTLRIGFTMFFLFFVFLSKLSQFREF